MNYAHAILALALLLCPAPAPSLQQTQNLVGQVAIGSSDSDLVLFFDQFDPALGTLIKIELDWDLVRHGDNVFFEHTHGVQETHEFGTAGHFSYATHQLRYGGTTRAETVTAGSYISRNMQAYDGTTDYSGSSGGFATPEINYFPSANWQTADAGILAAWTGTDTERVTVRCKGTGSGLSVLGSWETDPGASTIAAPIFYNVQVTFTYQP